MKNLLIINIDENLGEANKIIKKLNKDNLIAFYLNNNIFNKSIKYKLLDDYFKPEYTSKIEKQSRRIAKTWYKPIEDKFMYFGLSLPELIETDFLKIWPILLKIEILTKFTNKEKPKEIFIITESEEDIRILKEISQDKIKINYFLLKKAHKQPINLVLKDFLYKLIAKFQNYLFSNYILKNKNKRNNILYLGNLRQASPLLIKLNKNKKNVIIRAGENLGRSLFSRYCNHYITFKYYSDRKINSIINFYEKKLIDEWNKLRYDKKFNRNIFYKIQLFTILEPEFKYIILNRFKKLINYIEIMKKIAPYVNIVITHNDIISFEKTIVKTANNLKIPTLTTIEGFLSNKKITKGHPLLPFSARAMAMHSERQKHLIMKKYNIPEKRLIVTGYHVFDQYYNNKPLAKEYIYKRYKIPLNKDIVLYCAERYRKDRYESSILSAHTEKQYLNIYKELFRAIKKLPNLFLIIKKHPSELIDPSIINNLAKKEGFKDFKIVSDMDIHNIINASKIIILRLSTMGLESMILNKFVIIMDTYFDTDDNVGYTKFNAALHAKKPGELEMILKKLINDKNLQKKLEKNMEKFVKNNYVNDGGSSTRLTNLINNMINNKEDYI